MAGSSPSWETIRLPLVEGYVDGVWKGTQSGFIAHFKEQGRLYNEISDAPFAPEQLVNFLHAAVSGVPNLSQVLTLHNTAAQQQASRMACSHNDRNRFGKTELTEKQACIPD